MAEHISSFTETDDWPEVSCSCGWSSPPLPGMETAADVWGDHRAAAAVVSITAERDRLHKVVEAFAAAPPYGVTAKMNSRYCTVCGAIEGAGDLHLQSCAWRMAREALGLDAEWPEPTAGG